MAPPAGQFRPKRYLLGFVVIVAALYALVFATGDHQAKPKLGIDLQGGTTITLTPRTPDGGEPSGAALTRAREILNDRVNGLGVSGATVEQDGKYIVVTAPGPSGEQIKALSTPAKMTFRKVIGGVPGTGQLDERPPLADPVADLKLAQDQRQDPQLLGLAEDQNSLQQVLGGFVCPKKDALAGNDLLERPLVTCGEDGTRYLLAPVFPAKGQPCDPLMYTCLTGEDLDNTASSGPNPEGVGYVVNVNFKNSTAWANFTEKNVNSQVAIVMDTKVLSAPNIKQAILGGNTTISGDFNQKAAGALANNLKYGSLPLSFETSDAQTVSATLGLASLKAGLIAGGIGLVLVAVYCLFYYRLLGVLTILSLVLTGVVVFAVLVLLGRSVGFSLNLPGIAGFIIAIGITADSFVVFFERLKDEVREGRTFRSAVPRAWVRARRTILSADAVSFLAAAVLYILAVGDVKGFAFTLGMSTVLDLLVVFLVTHPLVAIASRSKFLSRPGLSGLGATQRAGAEQRAASAPVAAVSTATKEA